MTTHGPTTYSLADRLECADAVLVVDKAELVDVVVDEQSESRRQLGTFALHIARSLSGEPVEALSILVAQEPDGSWPVPSRGRFVALVQDGGRDATWTLVHNSAFPLERSTIRFDAGAGCLARGGEEPVQTRELERLIAEREARRATYAATLKELEPDSGQEARSTGEMEIPDPSLVPWLLGEHAPGGAAGRPEDSTSEPKQRGRKRSS